MDRRSRIEAAKEWFAKRGFHWRDGRICVEFACDPTLTVIRPATEAEIVFWGKALAYGSVGEIRKGVPHWK